MSEFCKECSLRIFGEDFKEFAGLCKPGEIVEVLCEDCGPMWADHTGTRVEIGQSKQYIKAQNDKQTVG